MDRQPGRRPGRFQFATQKAKPGQSVDLCQAIGHFGHAAFRLGDLVEAVEYGERAVTMAFESRPPVGIAHASRARCVASCC